jgi:hypothetical protein
VNIYNDPRTIAKNKLKGIPNNDIKGAVGPKITGVKTRKVAKI